MRAGLPTPGLPADNETARAAASTRASTDVWAVRARRYRHHMPRAPRFPLRLLVLSTTLALIAAVGTYVLLDSRDDGGRPSIELREVEEGSGEVTFTTYDEEVVPLADLRGGPVLVNFFASTCTPCIKEMPDLEEVHQELGDQVTFLGLAVADRPENAKDLVERTGVTYRTALDPESRVITELAATSFLPTTVLLGADGEVIEAHTGELDADGIRQLLADGLGIET